MEKSPSGHEERRGHPVFCAYCKREIHGVPVEKNGYLYDSENHANLDDKRFSGT